MLRSFILSILCLALVSPIPARAQITWEAAKLGNVFEVGESVAIPLETDADKVSWKIFDFWHKEVKAGATEVAGGQATVQPDIGTPGYYLLHAEPSKGGTRLKDAYVSFAIVHPNKPANPDGPFGVMTHFAQGMNPDMLPLFKKIGITTIRDEQYWSAVEKEKGQYQFEDRFTSYMKACQELGLLPLIEMTFGNKLYDHKDGPTTPAGFEAYGNYGQAILKQYGEQIKWLEVWNEYNGTWAPPAAKKDLVSRYTIYTGMLKEAYKKIKAIRPDVEVLGGAAVLIPLPYFEGMFKLGALDYMDAVVVHPYRPKPEGVDNEIAELQELIRKYNKGKDKPVWVTETGRHTKDEYDWEKGRKMFEKGRTEGARYLPRMYTLLLKAGVPKVYWYLASDHANFVSMGLLRNHKNEGSGMPRLSVAPAYVSYANLIHQLDGAQFVERQGFREYTRAYVQLFRKGPEEIRVAWATQPSKMGFKTAQPLTVVDIVGGESSVAPVNGQVVLDLTEDIQYVKGPVQAVAELDSGRRVIAAWPDDYTKTQGGNNWYYGYYEGEGPFQPAAFKELKQVETMWGYEWGGASRYLKVAQGGMHPDGGKAAALRWKSPLSGKLRIEGAWSRGGKGDGITGKVLLDGKEVDSRQVGGPAEKEGQLDLVLDIKKDALVDFVCLPNKGTDFDATSLKIVILEEK